MAPTENGAELLGSTPMHGGLGRPACNQAQDAHAMAFRARLTGNTRRCAPQRNRRAARSEDASVFLRVGEFE